MLAIRLADFMLLIRLSEFAGAFKSRKYIRTIGANTRAMTGAWRARVFTVPSYKSVRPPPCLPVHRHTIIHQSAPWVVPFKELGPSAPGDISICTLRQGSPKDLLS